MHTSPDCLACPHSARRRRRRRDLPCLQRLRASPHTAWATGCVRFTSCPVARMARAAATAASACPADVARSDRPAQPTPPYLCGPVPSYLAHAACPPRILRHLRPNALALHTALSRPPCAPLALPCSAARGTHDRASIVPLTVRGRRFDHVRDRYPRLGYRPPWGLRFSSPFGGAVRGLTAVCGDCEATVPGLRFTATAPVLCGSARLRGVRSAALSLRPISRAMTSRRPRFGCRHGRDAWRYRRVWALG